MLSASPTSSRVFPTSPGKSPPSLSLGKPRFVVWTLVLILIEGCAILAAAMRCRARTLPRTPRAFRETAWLRDRFLRLRETVEESGEGEREASGSVVTSRRSRPYAAAETCDICNEDRSGQL